MQPTCIHCLTTHTSVWFTGFRAQPVGHCYPDGLVCYWLDRNRLIIARAVRHFETITFGSGRCNAFRGV